MQGPLRSLLRWAHAAEDEVAKLPPELVGPVHAGPARAVLTRLQAAACCSMLCAALSMAANGDDERTKDSGVVGVSYRGV